MHIFSTLAIGPFILKLRGPSGLIPKADYPVLELGIPVAKKTDIIDVECQSS